MFKDLTTVSQGSIGLSGAIYYYQKSGFNVSVPLVDNKSYDLIVEKNNILFTVQVKTTQYCKYGDYLVQLKSVRPNKTKNVIKEMGKVDLLFVLCDNGDMYSIPFEKLLNKHNKPKTVITLKMYKDYKV